LDEAATCDKTVRTHITGFAMSSFDVFAHAAQVREQAVTLRHKADLVRQATDEAHSSPGNAATTLSTPTWAGTKASATEQLMRGSFGVLRYAIEQARLDVEDLLYQARRLDSEADQLEMEGRRLAHQEAEAEAARQRAIAAANAAAAAAAHAAAAARAAAAASSSSAAAAASNSAASSGTASAGTTRKLTFDPIVTTTITTTAAAASSGSSTSETASETTVAASAF
jgi:trimeric autotransporter adhesin